MEVLWTQACYNTVLMDPVLMVKRAARWLLKHARVIYFIDNEGVKEALVKGCSPALASRDMLVEVAKQEMWNNSLSWYARVPSPSNIADGVSRLEFKEILSYPDAKWLRPMV